MGAKVPGNFCSRERKFSVGTFAPRSENTKELKVLKPLVSELISELRWQSLEDCRKNARLSLFYKGLHGLAAIPANELQRPTRCTRYGSP